jgi:hypothetical protein
MGVGAAISWVVHRIPPPFVGLENGSIFDAWVSFPAALGLLPSDLPSRVNFVPIPLKEGENPLKKGLDFLRVLQRITCRGGPRFLSYQNAQTPGLQDLEDVFIGCIVPDVQGKSVRSIQMEEVQQ